MSARVRYLFATLKLEFALGAVMALGVTMGVLVVSEHGITAYTITIPYSMEGDHIDYDAVTTKVSSNWNGPGEASVLQESDVSGSYGNACGSRVVVLEARADLARRDSTHLVADVTSAAQRVGLNEACGGVRIQAHRPQDMGVAFGLGLGIVSPALIFLAWRSRRGRHWLIDWADWAPRVGVLSACGWGVVVGSASIVGAYTIEWLATQVGWGSSSHGAIWAGLPPENFFALAPLIVLGAPIVEEYIFRAWMLERFGRVMPIWLALCITAVAFAAAHVPQGLGPAVELTMGGFLLGWTWLKTRSWIACSLAHSIHNAAALMAMSLAFP